MLSSRKGDVDKDTVINFLIVGALLLVIGIILWGWRTGAFKQATDTFFRVVGFT